MVGTPPTTETALELQPGAPRSLSCLTTLRHVDGSSLREGTYVSNCVAFFPPLANTSIGKCPYTRGHYTNFEELKTRGQRAGKDEIGAIRIRLEYETTGVL